MHKFVLLTLSVEMLCGISNSQTTLREAARSKGIYYGTAVGGAFWGADSAAYKALIKQQCNVIVPENVMKFKSIEPSRNSFSWQQPDDLVAFAEENGMKIRGHTLLWHEALPTWISSGNFSRNEMLSIIKTHIDSVVGRYKGRIFAWDVVNEAIDDGTGTLRSTIFSSTIGADFIDSAFAFAHRADPSAVLYYNDYGGEESGTKADKIYNLVAGLKQRGIVIGGVGLQFHWEGGVYTGFSPPISQNLKRLAALGLEVAITEADLRITLPVDSVKLDKQAQRYSALMKIFLDSRPAAVTFLTWGITDKYSWVPGFFTGTGAALPFDSLYQPKPAFYALLNAMKSAPIGIRPAKQNSIQMADAFHADKKNSGDRMYSIAGRKVMLNSKRQTRHSGLIVVEKGGGGTLVK